MLDTYSRATCAFVAGPGITATTLRAGAFASLDVGENGPEGAFTESPMLVDGTTRVTGYRFENP